MVPVRTISPEGNPVRVMVQNRAGESPCPEPSRSEPSAPPGTWSAAGGRRKNPMPSASRYPRPWSRNPARHSLLHGTRRPRRVETERLRNRRHSLPLGQTVAPEGAAGSFATLEPNPRARPCRGAIDTASRLFRSRPLPDATLSVAPATEPDKTHRRRFVLADRPVLPKRLWTAVGAKLPEGRRLPRFQLHEEAFVVAALRSCSVLASLPPKGPLSSREEIGRAHV